MVNNYLDLPLLEIDMADLHSEDNIEYVTFHDVLKTDHP